MSTAEGALRAGTDLSQKDTLTSTYKTRDRRRREDLIVALRTLRDVSETLQRGDSGGRFEPDSKILQMPAAWHAGCHPQLFEALRLLRRIGPRHYWNVDARYISPDRTNQTLVYRGGRYFEAIDIRAVGDTRPHVSEGPPLDLSRTEVLRSVTEVHTRVSSLAKGRKAVAVRAIVERWNAAVEHRPLEMGIDFLLSQMPATIRLPREIRAAL